MPNSLTSQGLISPKAVVHLAKPRYLLATIQIDGVARYRLPILRAMQDRGWEVHAMVPRTAGLEELQSRGVIIHSVDVDRGSTNPLQEMRTLRQFKEIIGSVNPDLSHHFSTKAVIFGCLPNIGLNVATVTGIGYSLSGKGSSLKKRPAQIMAKQMYRAAMKHCDRVIFQNEHDQNVFIQRKIAKADQTEVIQGSGIDMTHYHPQKRNHREGPVRFALVARMLVSKGVADFVAAAKMASERTQVPCEFLLVGPLDHQNPSCIRESQIREWESQGYVKWVGPFSDSLDVYKDADVAVLPSYYNEGLSRSLVEAAAMGLPIITTDNPGCRDTVLPNESGLVVPMRNPEQLANAMVKLANEFELRQSMGRSGRLFVESRFSKEYVIDRVMETYDQVLIAGGKAHLV